MSDESQGSHLPHPGEEHLRLKPFEGTFIATVKIWMGEREPMQSTGVMTNSFHIGGLYLHQDYVGDKSDGPFPNFIGKGYWGFNTTTAKYEGFWIDNASTTMQLEKGIYDSVSNSWEMHSEFDAGESRIMKKRTVITLVDGDSHKMESYFEAPGQDEFKNMEITYKRK